MPCFLLHQILMIRRDYFALIFAVVYVLHITTKKEKEKNFFFFLAKILNGFF